MIDAKNFQTLVDALRRVVHEPGAYIEITFSVLTLRVYPGRERGVALDRLKYLTSFMLTLADELDGPPTRLAFEYDDDALSVGLLRDDGREIWMPCEIHSLDRTLHGAPATVRFSFLDADGEPIDVPMPEFRRVRLP
jgi:hypothetical protein